MTTITPEFQYPRPQVGDIIITRYEYDLLRSLFCKLSAERLCGATLGIAETLNAVNETDAVLAKLQQMYLGKITVHLN